MHVPVGVSKFCQKVVYFKVWQRYTLTLMCGILMCCIWYFTVYQMFAKKYQTIAQELARITDHHKDLQNMLTSINKLEAECDRLHVQLNQSCAKASASDLLLWYDLINKEHMMIENCTSADLVDHEWYKAKKIMCSFKSTFANLMNFFEKLVGLKELYACDELSIHANENGDLTVHGIFQHVQVKESCNV